VVHCNLYYKIHRRSGQYINTVYAVQFIQTIPILEAYISFIQYSTVNVKYCKMNVFRFYTEDTRFLFIVYKDKDQIKMFIFLFYNSNIIIGG
jgi:hypothetical protein